MSDKDDDKPVEVVKAGAAPFKRYQGGSQYRKMNLAADEPQEEDEPEEADAELRKDENGNIVMIKLETD